MGCTVSGHTKGKIPWEMCWEQPRARPACPSTQKGAPERGGEDVISSGQSQLHDRSDGD